MKFVGPVNSASMHCSREKSQPIRLKKKKKRRKRELSNADKQ